MALCLKEQMKLKSALCREDAEKITNGAHRRRQSGGVPTAEKATVLYHSVSE
jgi:hypothetical protein